MDIRKISIGADYKSGAMLYIVGQDVLGGNYQIHLIQHDHELDSYKIWIIKNEEISDADCFSSEEFFLAESFLSFKFDCFWKFSIFFGDIFSLCQGSLNWLNTLKGYSNLQQS